MTSFFVLLKNRRKIMASSLEYVKFIAEQLSELEEISYRKMFGEYAFYYKGKVFGGVYDNRFLIKVTKAGKKLCENFEEQLPYKGAKPMLFISELDDKNFLKNLVEATWQELPFNKKKK